MSIYMDIYMVITIFIMLPFTYPNLSTYMVITVL
jgi:hypothetical protein